MRIYISYTVRRKWIGYSIDKSQRIDDKYNHRLLINTSTLQIIDFGLLSVSICTWISPTSSSLYRKYIFIMIVFTHSKTTCDGRINLLPNVVIHLLPYYSSDDVVLLSIYGTRWYHTYLEHPVWVFQIGWLFQNFRYWYNSKLLILCHLSKCCFYYCCSGWPGGYPIQ